MPIFVLLHAHHIQKWLWSTFLPEYIEHPNTASVTVEPISAWVHWASHYSLSDCKTHFCLSILNYPILPQCHSVTGKPISAWVHWASQYSLSDCETHFCLSTLSIPITPQWLGNPFLPEYIEQPNTSSVTVKPISAWVILLLNFNPHFCLSTKKVWVQLLPELAQVGPINA